MNWWQHYFKEKASEVRATRISLLEQYLTHDEAVEKAEDLVGLSDADFAAHVNYMVSAQARLRANAAAKPPKDESRSRKARVVKDISEYLSANVFHDNEADEPC